MGQTHEVTSTLPLIEALRVSVEERAGRHLMIDPSILLAPHAFNAIAEAAMEEPSDQLFVPASLLEALGGPSDLDVWRHFAPAHWTSKRTPIRTRRELRIGLGRRRMFNPTGRRLQNSPTGKRMAYLISPTRIRTAIRGSPAKFCSRRGSFSKATRGSQHERDGSSEGSSLPEGLQSRRGAGDTTLHSTKLATNSPVSNPQRNETKCALDRYRRRWGSCVCRSSAWRH